MTERERNIAIGVGAAGGLALLYWFVWQPYSGALDDLNQQVASTSHELNDGNAAVDEQHSLQRVWIEMNKNGLRPDASTAESQFYSAMLAWTRNAGTSEPSFKSDPIRSNKDAEKNNFEEEDFHVSVTGSMPSISKLLWEVETAPIPVRVRDVQLSPKKEGLDDPANPLTAQITVSTLFTLTGTDNTAAATANDSLAMAGGAR